MVLEIIEATLEARVIHLLLEMYPATVEDIRRELKARQDLLDRTLAGMVANGIVELEPLPDRTYVRLIRFDFAFVGRNVSQRKRVKHHGRPPSERKDYDGPMFG